MKPNCVKKPVVASAQNLLGEVAGRDLSALILSDDNPLSEEVLLEQPEEILHAE